MDPSSQNESKVAELELEKSSMDNGTALKHVSCTWDGSIRPGKHPKEGMCFEAVPHMFLCFHMEMHLLQPLM